MTNIRINKQLIFLDTTTHILRVSKLLTNLVTNTAAIQFVTHVSN